MAALSEGAGAGEGTATGGVVASGGAVTSGSVVGGAIGSVALSRRAGSLPGGATVPGEAPATEAPVTEAPATEAPTGARREMVPPTAKSAAAPSAMTPRLRMLSGAAEARRLTSVRESELTEVVWPAGVLLASGTRGAGGTKAGSLAEGRVAGSLFAKRMFEALVGKSAADDLGTGVCEGRRGSTPRLGGGGSGGTDPVPLRVRVQREIGRERAWGTVGSS